jgi:hypothetical protein
MRYILALIFVSISCCFASHAAAQQSDRPLNERLTSATTACTIVRVYYPKSDKKFDIDGETVLVGAAMRRAGFRDRYTEATGSRCDKADIIVRVEENRLLERISMEVLNPDDNSVLWTESRDLVDLDNDVNRLTMHFLQAVASQPPLVNQNKSNQAGDPGPTYVFIGRYDREESAQTAAKKVEGLGLAETVVPRHDPAGDFYIVYTGPFGAKRIPGVIQWLKALGFTNACEVRRPDQQSNQ